MKNRLLAVLLWVLLIIPPEGVSQVFSDYLILEDIGPYKLEKPQKVVGGYIGGPRVFGGAGPIAPTGHFYIDHVDKTYEAYYEGAIDSASPKVQVTQHAGSDSDRWLLHEVDRDFRNYYGLPGDSYVIRVVDSSPIMAAGSGGWTYRWISGNKVIHIEYTDLQMEKPEPLEVVGAYIAKHPSSLPLMTSSNLRTRDNKTIWIKNEMERRLWLCDKWYLQLQMGKVGLDETLITVVKSMVIFLDYRERYYGIKAKDEKLSLLTNLNQKDGTSIKSKLSTYKTWWAVNKGRSISLP